MAVYESRLLDEEKKKKPTQAELEAFFRKQLAKYPDAYKHLKPRITVDDKGGHVIVKGLGNVPAEDRSESVVKINYEDIDADICSKALFKMFKKFNLKWNRSNSADDTVFDVKFFFA